MVMVYACLFVIFFFFQRGKSTHFCDPFDQNTDHFIFVHFWLASSSIFCSSAPDRPSSFDSFGFVCFQVCEGWTQLISVLLSLYGLVSFWSFFGFCLGHWFKSVLFIYLFFWGGIKDHCFLTLLISVLGSTSLIFILSFMWCVKLVSFLYLKLSWGLFYAFSVSLLNLVGILRLCLNYVIFYAHTHNLLLSPHS